MKLLAIHTAGPSCSVALNNDGVVTTKITLQPNQHTAVILEMIQALLQQQLLQLADLDLLSFCRGPGSFTGLRIGASVIQGLAYALDQPVIPVSSLATLAQAAFKKNNAKHALVIQDARLDEVYIGEYQLDQQGLMCLIGTEKIVKPEVIIANSTSKISVGIGNGFKIYAELFKAIRQQFDVIDPDLEASAEDMLPLAQGSWLRGESVTAAEALPVYLRNNVAHKQN